MRKGFVTFIVALLMIIPLGVMALSFYSMANYDGVVRAKEFYNSKVMLDKPCSKADGSKYRIAYVDIDPYPASGEMLYYFVEELKNTGWITLDEKLPFDSANTDAKELINYLADKDLGDYIEFSKDANYYIAVDDPDECKESIRKHVKNKDIDLIFCMGTSPAEMVIKDLGVTDVPVMVYFSVDPVSAGLSKSEEYSGQKNVWCHTSSDVYLNQLQFYYDNFPFTNIGMVYYSESVGAMAQYRTAAERIGCDISEIKIDTLTTSEPEQVEAYYEMLEDKFKMLVNEKHIDAFMLGTDIIKDANRVEDMLEIFYKAGIPVFVQNGEYYVEKGAMIVVTASDAQSQAPFAVNAMSLIFNGRNPGDVYQKFVISPYVSINMDVTKRLQYDVSENLLLSAEKLVSTQDDK